MHFTKTILAALGVLLVLAGSAFADSSSSNTGTLASSTDTVSLVFVVGGSSSENVTIQTLGFGGGVNAAGQTIAAGGFDPFVGVFSGTGSTASIVTDGMGDLFGTSDALSNFGGFAGCPPAETVNIGGSICGDITMQLAFLPGTYTLLLTDALYIPNAVFDNGTLGEGFSDFTGGALQTCNTDSSGATTCANDTGNWAVDLTTSGSTVPAPEPGALYLLAGGLGALELLRRRRDRSAGPACN
jgi:hypothetical protein